MSSDSDRAKVAEVGRARGGAIRCGLIRRRCVCVISRQAEMPLLKTSTGTRFEVGLKFAGG